MFGCRRVAAYDFKNKTALFGHFTDPFSEIRSRKRSAARCSCVVEAASGRSSSLGVRSIRWHSRSGELCSAGRVEPCHIQESELISSSGASRHRNPVAVSVFIPFVVPRERLELSRVAPMGFESIAYTIPPPGQVCFGRVHCPSFWSVRQADRTGRAHKIVVYYVHGREYARTPAFPSRRERAWGHRSCADDAARPRRGSACAARKNS